MQQYIETSFNVVNFIEAYRNIGYSIEAAVSDIIDNSISAKATKISLDVVYDKRETEEPYIKISDNGIGMNNEELIEAMHLACRSPLEDRSPDDLGRFGLGLKSASFSQSRYWTVVSRKEGCATVGKTWDLDHVIESGKLEITECSMDSIKDVLPYEKGTSVIWSKLDRHEILNGTDEKKKQYWEMICNRLYFHIAITYCSFNNIEFYFNDNRIDLWDPFALKNKETNVIADEIILYGNDKIRIRSYTLPLDYEGDEKIQQALNKTRTDMQGFYIFRSSRLIFFGSWLDLPKMNNKEAYRLARIRMDIGNTMDEAWQLDIKKSVAVCPPGLVSVLLGYAKKARSESASRFRFRGKTIKRKIGNDDDWSFIWNYGINKDSKPFYSINRTSPILKQFESTLSKEQKKEFSKVLKCFENFIPIMSILEQETSSENGFIENISSRLSEEEIIAMFDSTLNNLINNGLDRHSALNKCLRAEPFSSYLYLFEDEQKEIF